MSLTRIEQETGINYNNEEDFAIVYTAHNALIIKLDMLCGLYPKDFKHTVLIGDDEEIKSYHIPKKYVSVRIPRILSEKQKDSLKIARSKLPINISKNIVAIVKKRANFNKNTKQDQLYK